MALGPIVFVYPYVLLALIGLPVLWVILRALPPRPKTHVFAAVPLLLGLHDQEVDKNKTPLWLIVLRSLIVVLIVVGLAQPRWAPDGPQRTQDRILIFIDGGWAQANAPALVQQQMAQLIASPTFADKRIAILNAAEPAPVLWQPALQAAQNLRDWQAAAWDPDWQGSLDILRDTQGNFDVFWASDGLDYAGARADLIQAFQSRGDLQIYQRDQSFPMILGVDQSDTVLTVMVAAQGADLSSLELRVEGVDPSGQPITIATRPISLAGRVSLDIPRELQARITRFRIVQHPYVGAQYIIADQLRRPQVGIVIDTAQNEQLDVLDPLNYVEQAIAPYGDIVRGSVDQLMLVQPDVMIAADTARLPQTDAIQEWVTQGGHLLRFAGPAMANVASQFADDPLLPVQMRQGGRNLGGTMSWQTPKTLADFDPLSPFYQLDIPSDVTIRAQVLAEPSPDLADKVLARLQDGTPLVTQDQLGVGRISLFHVTATPQWSNLPLSGLFVEMLQRLVRPTTAGAAMAQNPDTEWTVLQTLDARGLLQDPDYKTVLTQNVLSQSGITQDAPLGIYQSQNSVMTRNLVDVYPALEPVVWPSNLNVITDAQPQNSVEWMPFLLIAALVLLCADVLASLMVSGRRVFATIAVMVVALGITSDHVRADTQRAPDEIALAHIKTGDARVDALALAAMVGLSDTLFFRTSVEPSAPVSLDIERDTLAFYPLIYWPIIDTQPSLSARAVSSLNAFLRSGGVILFDTMDAELRRGNSAQNPKLMRLLQDLDIPPLEPVAADHVLTRAFYLLQDFPGRYRSGQLWAEAPTDTQTVDGLPFRPLNDGVSPVFIGSNDWAAAWAMDSRGEPLVPVGRGRAGERQREIALRFGVNLVMHVLTGNYKSDQVHVPALLDRLGQ